MLSHPLFCHAGQAARYQDLAQKGAGSVQNAQQYTSQLHQQEAALQTAQANLELAKRQLESLTAQRMSAEASLEQAKAQLGPSAGESRAHWYSIPRRWLRDELDGAAWGLCECRGKCHFACRRRFILD